jgi:hypothetical protein
MQFNVRILNFAGTLKINFCENIKYEYGCRAKYVRIFSSPFLGGNTVIRRLQPATKTSYEHAQFLCGRFFCLEIYRHSCSAAESS